MLRGIARVGWGLDSIELLVAHAPNFSAPCVVEIFCHFQVAPIIQLEKGADCTPAQNLKYSQLDWPVQAICNHNTFFCVNLNLRSVAANL